MRSMMIAVILPLMGFKQLLDLFVMTTFFTRDKVFYRSFFVMMITIALQNLIAYSVNMADNVMLGSYSQSALSAAATVNQIFFLVQQFALSIGDGLVVLASQYFGEKQFHPIRILTGIALKFAFICSIVFFVCSAVFPRQIISIFTTDEQIIAEGVEYLSIIKYTFILFILTSVLYCALRAVGVVRISFYISIVSLVVNVGINYVLIFGKFGMPEMGIKGAAIGTLVSRILELIIITVYLLKTDKVLKLFSENFLKGDRTLRKDFFKVDIPVMLSQILWGISVPMQTAVLGHLSADAIAANSVATTFYSYLKVVTQSVSAAAAVMIGSAVGRGDREEVKAQGRTISVIAIGIGLVLGAGLFFLRTPLLSLYTLNDNAMDLANQLIILMSIIMVTMSYQMPVSMGVIRGGGDTHFVVIMNIICVWGMVMPLTFMSAFWWHWPVVGVTLMIQLDQIIKCIPTFIKFRGYKWIKKLTRE